MLLNRYDLFVLSKNCNVIKPKNSPKTWINYQLSFLCCDNLIKILDFFVLIITFALKLT